MNSDRHFEAYEVRADAGTDPVTLRFAGSAETGWRIERNGAPHLELGPGFRLLACSSCGVCSTDLDRHFLPFPLPQVIGHEVVALDTDGRRYAVEINASHRARGVTSSCPWCHPADPERALPSHCPERLVLGIDRLPGGFAPWLLAPREALVPIPESLPDATAALVEPFAAALHGVRRARPRAGDTVAVLGTRRLGLLAVAALASERRRGGGDFEILALSRHASLRGRALSLGADRAEDPELLPAGPVAELVIDTTGSPEGFERALSLAGRELHLKSTHGRPAGGLAHATALVVDELGIAPLDAADGLFASGRLPVPGRGAWLAPGPAPAVWEARGPWVCERDALAARDRLASQAPEGTLPGADWCVVDQLAGADAAIRPSPDDERSLVRPRGWILVRDGTDDESALARALSRGVILSSSRCGSFRDAVSLLAGDPALSALGEALVTHRLPATRLPEALALARTPACIKALVEHAEHRAERAG